nr:hypothetical protein Ade03nite_02330 [Actinoplanes derwentensis]
MPLTQPGEDPPDQPPERRLVLLELGDGLPDPAEPKSQHVEMPGVRPNPLRIKPASPAAHNGTVTSVRFPSRGRAPAIITRFPVRTPPDSAGGYPGGGGELDRFTLTSP